MKIHTKFKGMIITYMDDRRPQATIYLFNLLLKISDWFEILNKNRLES